MSPVLEGIDDLLKSYNGSKDQDTYRGLSRSRAFDAVVHGGFRHGEIAVYGNFQRGPMSKISADKPTHKFIELLQYPEMNGVVIQAVIATFMNKQASNYLCKELMNYIRDNARFGYNHRFSFVQDGTIAATDDILLQSVMYTEAGNPNFRGILARFYKPAPGEAVKFCLETSRDTLVSCF